MPGPYALLNLPPEFIEVLETHNDRLDLLLGLTLKEKIRDYQDLEVDESEATGLRLFYGPLPAHGKYVLRHTIVPDGNLGLQHCGGYLKVTYEPSALGTASGQVTWCSTFAADAARLRDTEFCAWIMCNTISRHESRLTAL
jgi:hypothetical protein